MGQTSQKMAETIAPDQAGGISVGTQVMLIMGFFVAAIITGVFVLQHKAQQAGCIHTPVTNGFHISSSGSSRKKGPRRSWVRKQLDACSRKKPKRTQIRADKPMVKVVYRLAAVECKLSRK